MQFFQLKAMLLAFCALMAHGALADTVFYWTGGDGTWSDRANWSTTKDGKTAASRYPGELGYDDDHQDSAYFTTAASGKVKLDVDVTLYRVLFDGNAQSSTMELYCDEGAVKYITTKSTNNSANDRPRFLRNVDCRNLGYSGKYLDINGTTHFYSGCSIKTSTSIYAWDSDAEVFIEDGATVNSALVSYTAGSRIYLKGGSFTGNIGSGNKSGSIITTFVEVSGGSHTFKTLSIATDSSSFKMTGGTVVLNGYTLSDQATFAFTGGKIISTKVAIGDPRLLGTGAAILETSFDSSLAVNPVTEAHPAVSHSATLIATNGDITALAISATNGLFRSTGTVWARRLRVDEGISGYFQIANLALGRDLSFADGGAIHFDDGQTFNSFGDWTVSKSDSWGSVYLGGRQKFVTTDCFDGVTPHTITLSQFYTACDTDVEVSGCGTLNWQAKKYTRLGELAVDADATFVPGGKVTADKLTLGAGATVNLTAGTSALSALAVDADATSAFAVTVPSGLSNFAYPVIDAPLENPAAQIHLSGEGADGFTVASLPGVAGYLKSTGTYTPPAAEGSVYSNLWTGASSAYLDDAENWRLGVVPASASSSADTTLYIDGYTNLDITNNLSSSFKFKQMKFTETCGPVRISGTRLNPCSYSYFKTGHNGSSFVSYSPFPILLDAPIKSASNRLHFLNEGGSYFRINDAYVNGGIYVIGHLQINGTLAASGGLYVDTGDYPTILEIFTDSRLVVSNQYDFNGGDYRAVWNDAATFRIHVGGKVEFLATGKDENVFGWKKDIENLVDGEFAVRCPFTGKGQLTFRGTGTVDLDDVFATNANATVVLGGGVTFQSHGFKTASAAWPSNFIAMAVTDAASLAADDGSWRYGPADATALEELSTTAEVRALRIERGAKLTITGGGHSVCFADPILGPGTLSFASGAKIEPAGAMADAARENWTTVAAVGAVENLENLSAASKTYRWRIVEQDGEQLLQAKATRGMVFLIR